MVQSEQQTSVEAAAIERMYEFSRAMVKGDPEALEELLASDFTYTHMGGRVEPRDELIESVTTAVTTTAWTSSTWACGRTRAPRS